MGPSGSGKSTLLAVLSGLMQPEQGEVLALGQDLWRLSPAARKQFRQRHFGFIFQGYNLFPALTARQQLEIVLRWGEGVPGQGRQAGRTRCSTLLGLGGQEGPPAGTAVRRREAARGHRPGTGQGAAAHLRRRADQRPGLGARPAGGRAAARRGQRRGATVFVVSHDARIVPYADRVFHLEDGRLTEQDPTDARAKDLVA